MDQTPPTSSTSQPLSKLQKSLSGTSPKTVQFSSGSGYSQQADRVTEDDPATTNCYTPISPLLQPLETAIRQHFLPALLGRDPPVVLNRHG